MLSDTFNPTDVPRISMNYKSTFKWRGRGKISKEEYQRLVQLVHAAKSQDKELRFWNMPHSPSIWRVFLDAGVHRINIDRYRKFKKFYLAR
jgi:alkaline phosphatase